MRASIVSLVTLAAFLGSACSAEDDSTSTYDQSIGSAPSTGATESGGSSGSGSAAGSGSTVGTGATTGTGASTGSGSGAGTGATTGSGSTTGTGATTGSGSAAGTGAAAGTGSAAGTGVGCVGADIACDDFEAGSIDPAKWRTVAATMGGAEPALDSSKGHESTSSVRFEMANGVGRFLTSVTPFPSAGQLYVRAYVSFASATKDMTGHGAFIIGSTGDSNTNELRFGASRDGCSAPNFLLDLNHIPTDTTICSSGQITGGNPADAIDPDGVTLEANTWYCVETFWDDAVGEFRLWIDDTEVETLHATANAWCPIGKTCSAPPNPWPIDFNLVKFGVQNYNGSSGTVWYDDVAFATQRIGCE
jgi:hypothetical protein